MFFSLILNFDTLQDLKTMNNNTNYKGYHPRGISSSRWTQNVDWYGATIGCSRVLQ